MMEQYFDLLGACAQGGAQAFGDAALLIQVYLITFSVMLVALIVACWALLGRADSEPSRRSGLMGEGLQGAMRQRLWERFSAAWAADEAAEVALRLTGRAAGETAQKEYER